MKKNHPEAAMPAAAVGLMLRLAVAALLAFGAALHAHAQVADADPPGRVARLSDVIGQVWFYNSADSNEWLSVDRNRPLTTGDHIATDNGARAEITLGTTTLRLDSGTELEIAQLDDSRYVVHLVSGSVAARLRNPQSLAEFALETDEGRFRAQAVGRYRFDHADRASDLTVFSGQAVFEGRNSALPLTAGQHARFWLDAAGAAQYSMIETSRDDFARWNDDRDRAEDRMAAVRYVSPEMTGAQDLDEYGQWEQTPEYGALWTPRGVAVGWAPYSSGHWAWVPPWGWTWVDDAPWGFAPFHYGRWVYRRDVWCWAPGAYVARPVYAPALVAWVGGPRVGVSISIGGGGPPVGWFALAPHEVYVPSYRTSPGYVRNINITHVTNVVNITNIVNNRNGEADRREFANRRFPNAVTVVPASVLTSRQAVGPSAAQFRNNPQMRAFVADGRPALAMTAAPVAAPAFAARPAEGMRPVRPPQGLPARSQSGAADPTAISRPPPRGGIMRDPAAETGAAQPGAAPPSPVQRAPRGETPGSRIPEPSRPVEAQRPPGVPRAVDAPRSVAVPPQAPVRPAEPQRAPEAQRGTPEQRTSRPDTPRTGREERRDEPREANDKQK